MKRRTILVAGTVAAAALLSAALPMSRILLWNETASVPTGLYHIRGTASLHVGERVAIDPPPGLRTYLAERGYLPSGVPLLKEVAALRGDNDNAVVSSRRLTLLRQCRCRSDRCSQRRGAQHGDKQCALALLWSWIAQLCGN